MPKLTQDRTLGLVAIALGLFIALYWAGADSETGLVEKTRGRYSIGDALAPTVAAVFLSLSGLWLAVSGGPQTTLSLRNAGFIMGVLMLLFVSLGLMRWGGPWLVEAITAADYRPLRDTVPWKYVGFVLGGTAMIAALTFVVERQLRWSRVLIALGVTLFLAAFYDLPFEDLLLPPNGDV
ncbi:MAG: hypothetical protein AAFV19_21365 [Pseudomonadota bacterium]